MIEHPMHEPGPLRRQVARLESEIQESTRKLGKQEDRLSLLILTLAVDRGIYAVSKSGGCDWQLLSREEFILRRSKTQKEKQFLKAPESPDQRAA